MNKKSLDLSGKIDEHFVKICQTVSKAADHLDIPFFFVGATALDLIFHKGYGIPAKRATYDIDIAVEVKDWAAFEALKNYLVSTDDFVQTPQAHRLNFKLSVDVDIVPFGAIADEKGNIAWPPDEANVMSTIGFSDACEDTISVILTKEPYLEIAVASPAAITVLKIFAWKDRGQDNRKDAIDLSNILSDYIRAGNDERLFREHDDLLLTEGFDYDLSGARILGRDIGKFLKPETIKCIQNILMKEIQENDHSRNQLIIDMSDRYDQESFTRNLIKLRALLFGIEDTV